MSFLFSSKAPAKPTPGFHPIELPEDPKPREYAPDEVEAAIRLQAGIRMIRARRTAQGLRGAKIQHAAAASVQAFFRGGATRTAMSALKKEKLEQKATRHTAAQRIQEQFRNTHPPESSEAPPDEGDGALPPAEAFVIRNLDTGEAVSLELGKSDGDAGASTLVPGQVVSFGTLQQNPQAWEALKGDSKGLLEKLASSTTLSFRSYQLCVWQERYVYASDDALCYQHLSSDMQPTGSVKQIPYSSIEFVGAPCRPPLNARPPPGPAAPRHQNSASRRPRPPHLAHRRPVRRAAVRAQVQGARVHLHVRQRRDAHALDQEHFAARRLLRVDGGVPQDDHDGALTDAADVARARARARARSSAWVLGRAASWHGRSEAGRAASRGTCLSLLNVSYTHPICLWSCCPMRLVVFCGYPCRLSAVYGSLARRRITKTFTSQKTTRAGVTLDMGMDMKRPHNMRELAMFSQMPKRMGSPVAVGQDRGGAEGVSGSSSLLATVLPSVLLLLLLPVARLDGRVPHLRRLPWLSTRGCRACEALSRPRPGGARSSSLMHRMRGGTSAVLVHAREAARITDCTSGSSHWIGEAAAVAILPGRMFREMPSRPAHGAGNGSRSNMTGGGRRHPAWRNAFAHLQDAGPRRNRARAVVLPW